MGRNAGRLASLLGCLLAARRCHGAASAALAGRQSFWRDELVICTVDSARCFA